MIDARLAQLIGSWRLVSFGLTFVDTRERIEPYGPHPDGIMVLSANGRIMFLLTTPNRERPKSDQDRAALFNAMTAYSGFARIEGDDRLVIAVDAAWDPSWSGEQTRYFILERDRLSLRSPEQHHPRSAERLVVGDLIWERETDPLLTRGSPTMAI
jgi:hypothetical protein